MRFALIATIPLGNGERIAVVVSGDEVEEGCDPLEDDLPAHLVATLDDLLVRLTAGRIDACRTRLLDSSADDGDACALEILAARYLSAILGGDVCCAACHCAASRRRG